MNRGASYAILLAMSGSVLFGQTTVQELVRSLPAGAATTVSIHPMYPSIDLGDVVSRADLVVEGQIVGGKASITPNQTFVQTTYTIDVNQVLSAHVGATDSLVANHDHQIQFTEAGGDLSIDGKTVHAVNKMLPAFRGGERVILALMRKDGSETYAIYGGPSGAFSLETGRVRPHTPVPADSEMAAKYAARGPEGFCELIRSLAAGAR